MVVRKQVICCLMETVDDTVLMKKAIVSELTADLWAMMSHKSARLCLLHLLAPRAPRYQPTHLLHCLPVLGDDGMPLPITLVGEMAKAQGKKRARKDDDDDEGEREKDGEEEAEEEEEGEEEGEAGGEKEQLAGGVKKPFEVKRRELLGGNGGLGEMLVRLLLPRECVLVARAPSGEAPGRGTELWAGAPWLGAPRGMSSPGGNHSQHRRRTHRRSAPRSRPRPWEVWAPSALLWCYLRSTDHACGFVLLSGEDVHGACGRDGAGPRAVGRVDGGGGGRQRRRAG